MLVSLPPFRPPCPWPRAFALGALSLATLLVSASTRAETRKALLIANAEYRVDGMTLANPVRDAEKVRASLLAAGFAKADVALVRDVPARGIENVVGVFADSLEPGDVALFYYSGHGMQSKGVNYLLGTGFDEKREADVPYGDVYPVRKLIRTLESSRASVRFVIIDACRDMPLARGWKGGATDGFAVEPKGEGGTLLAFATSPNSRASDVGFDGGPYAHVLSQQLLRPGKEALHLFRDIQNEVRRLTRGEQVPAYEHNLLADFYFVPARSAPSPGLAPRPAPKPRHLEIPEGMVKVPGGHFYMGCNEKLDSECDPDEKPGRTMKLPPFFIDVTEVTVNAYAACVGAGKCSDHHLDGYEWPGQAFTRSGSCNWSKSERGEHPINCVAWQQANQYCAWKGHRLPTEPEWEKAARGTDGQKYPWGNTGYEQTPVANIADETAKRTFSGLPIAEGYEDGLLETGPVGSFPRGASPYDALDMIGNVWEWTSDEYSSDEKLRVARGGGWRDEPAYARASNRYGYSPSYRNYYLGFRCAHSDSSDP